MKMIIHVHCAHISLMPPNSSTLCNLASALALEWHGSSEIHQDPVTHHIPWPPSDLAVGCASRASLAVTTGLFRPCLFLLILTGTCWNPPRPVRGLLFLSAVRLILPTLPLAWTLVFVDVQKTPQPQSPGFYVHSPECLVRTFNSTCPKPNSIVGPSALRQSFL